MFLQEFLLIWKATFYYEQGKQCFVRYQDTSRLTHLSVSTFHIDHPLACFIFGVLRWDETLLVFSIYLFSVSGFLMSDSSCLMYYYSVFEYQMKHSFSCFICYFSVSGYQMEHFLLVFDMLLLSVWISDETILLVFDLLLLGVWISDETLLPCLIYYFSVFGY